MFGRKAREEEREREREARHERADAARQQYWKRRFELAKDEHETTRIYVEMRHDQLILRLEAFERRMGEQAQVLMWAICACCVVLVGLGWWR